MLASFTRRVAVSPNMPILLQPDEKLQGNMHNQLGRSDRLISDSAVYKWCTQQGGSEVCLSGLLRAVCVQVDCLCTLCAQSLSEGLVPCAAAPALSAPHLRLTHKRLSAHSRPAQALCVPVACCLPFQPVVYNACCSDGVVSPPPAADSQATERSQPTSPGTVQSLGML